MKLDTSLEAVSPMLSLGLTKIRTGRAAETIAADLCMFGLTECDEGGPGLVNASVLMVTNSRRCGYKVNAQAHIDALVLMRSTQVRKWNKQEDGVHQVARAMEERLERTSKS